MAQMRGNDCENTIPGVKDHVLRFRKQVDKGEHSVVVAVAAVNRPCLCSAPSHPTPFSSAQGALTHVRTLCTCGGWSRFAISPRAASALNRATQNFCACRFR